MRWFLNVFDDLLLIGTTCIFTAPIAAAPRDLVPVERETVGIPASSFRSVAAKRSLNGDLLFLSIDSAKGSRSSIENAVLRRITPTGETRTFSLANAAAAALTSASLALDLATGPGGEIHVPIVGHQLPPGHRGKHFVSGSFVFSAEGNYQRWIPFRPAAEARRLIVDQWGNLYVLGIDPEYIRGLAAQCFLVHKYAPDGTRLTAFSDCPDNAGHRIRIGINLVVNPHFQGLRTEADRGHLWLSGGSVYHVLPLSNTMRVFDPGGRLLRETTLVPPSESEILVKPFPLPEPVRERLIFGIFPVADGQFLVQWRLSAGTHRRTYFALHNAAGDALSKATYLRGMGPISADENGGVHFLRVHGSTGAKELVRMDFTLR